MRSKRNFLDKNLWHIVLICIRRVRWLATHQSQSSQNTPSLEYKVVEQLPTWPIPCHQYITRAVSLTKCRFKLPSPNLPSSGLVGFYVRQVVCVCFYSLCKNMYYTCNVEYTARCARPASRLAQPFLGRKYSPNDLYSTHRLPLCRALLTVQFAGVIEVAADFLLHPLYCANYQAIYQTWQAMRKQTRPCAWHLNSARGPAILASGLQKVGPEPSSSLLSLSTKRICNNHHDGTILIPLQLIFLLICVTWPEMQIGLFYNLGVAHSKIVWKMHPTEPASQKQC